MQKNTRIKMSPIAPSFMRVLIFRKTFTPCGMMSNVSG